MGHALTFKKKEDNNDENIFIDDIKYTNNDRRESEIIKVSKILNLNNNNSFNFDYKTKNSNLKKENNLNYEVIVDLSPITPDSNDSTSKCENSTIYPPAAVGNSILSSNNTTTISNNSNKALIKIEPSESSSRFSKYKYDLFNCKNNNNTFKKLLIINLLAVLIKVYKFKYLHENEHLGSSKSVTKFKTNKNNYIFTSLGNLVEMYNKIDTEYLNKDLQEKYQVIEEVSVTKQSSFLRMKDLDKNCYIILKTYFELEEGVINEKIISNEIRHFKRLKSRYILEPRKIILNKNDAYIFFDNVEYSLFEYINTKEINLNSIWRLFRNLISGIDYCKHNI